ncbi:uncharacterized protein Z520_01025 [Fonsecaea multimorphosa CBS 102226]|uniref:Uncharacterized protein n=1 Tax=Fonsecaea multimorphosa CBS 102226 TaxID=1442371 RepID=A0A0D2KGI2_9EURO|nr:uncharacterized protein Z520_01025 [Fonsecaea multimorphosa CBS 102226]KIY02560.1 hypothetical protein Z520_01025 [Fonsecaea multimorphosa CBS 102226]OAL31426.1 hypothetical protein AYO22_01018 [Fonsecaea multimorphosa]
MKKLARTLSARGSSSKSHPHPPSSNGISTARSSQAHIRKSSMTSPIPPFTHIHFPQCPHTTPPTPRPAHLPSVLRTEIVGGAKTPDNARSDEIDRNVQVRQYLTEQTHCLDCTLALASQQESWWREGCDAGVRELRMRVVELKSGLAALTAADDATIPAHGNGGEPDDETRKGAEMKLETEILCYEERIEEHLRRRDGHVKKLWDQVRKDWEGGVREVVRDDGTGEAEEQCMFVFPWEEDKDVLAKGDDGIGQGEPRESVRLRWLPIEAERINE